MLSFWPSNPIYVVSPIIFIYKWGPGCWQREEMTRIQRKASKLTKFEPNVGRTNDDAHLILDF